jgi:hypothetical protein
LLEDAVQLPAEGNPPAFDTERAQAGDRSHPRVAQGRDARRADDQGIDR